MKKSSDNKIAQFSYSSGDVPFDVLIGRAAMVVFMFGFGVYLTTDALLPGFV